MKTLIKLSLFKELAIEVTRKNIEAYVVGGFVRDFLLDRKSKDVDIVVVGDGITFAKEMAKKWNTKLTIFKNFGTAMLNYGDIQIEFVEARKESYRKDSRKPIIEKGNLYDDQSRRDFTINTIAFSLKHEEFGNIIDIFNGYRDLEKEIIKTPLEPNITFSDDPLRMLRAIRFATQLNFTIEENTYTAIAENTERIKIVSYERISDELNKIILSPKPSIGFKLLNKTGLLKIILPELEQLKITDIVENISHKNVFFHSLQVLDNIAKHSDNLWLRWSALLHDIGKPATKKFCKDKRWTFYSHNYIGAKMIKPIFRRLKLPLNEKLLFVKKMVELHMRPIALVEDEVSDTAIRRLLFDAGDDIDDLMTLCEADITSKNEFKVKKYLNNFLKVRRKLRSVEERDSIRNFQPPIKGNEIMETFDLQPCKIVGEIKSAIKEAILEGDIPNEYNEAKMFMLQKGKELGLVPKA